MSQRGGIPLGRSLCGCRHARHGEPSHFSGAWAAGTPRTEPSSRHLSACACDCRAAPPPGSLEHITHTQMSIHGVMNVLEYPNDSFKKKEKKRPP